MTFPLSGAAEDLWFQQGTYTSSVTSNLSCSRASTGFGKTSTGTLTSFAVNTLRITDLGLLVEDARTNIIEDSQVFNTGAWGGSFLVITNNVAVAPDGTTTACSQVANNVGAGQAQRSTWNTASGIGTSAYTASIFRKIGTGSYSNAFINISDGTNGFGIIVNVTTGVITQTNTQGAPTGTSSSVEAYGSGWYRVSVTMNGTSGLMGQSSGPFNAATAASWHAGGLGPIWATTADGTSDSLTWGAQLELGAFASSYMPTSGGTFTRAADNITTAGNVQTDINAATGSIVVQVDNGLVAAVAANVVDSNGTNLLGFNSTNKALTSITATLATANNANRTTQDILGTAWSGAGRSLSLNGGTTATDATAQTPSATQHIGSTGSANFIFAYVERLTVWTTKISDSSLQGFTSGVEPTTLFAQACL